MLPLVLAPPAPFPPIVAQAAARETIAPGANLVTYYLMTSRGPLVVRAIALDPRVPTLRIETVLAHDLLISPGETVSSMAQRTGAIAGINADYFDIGQTNQPLNIVVRDGALLRTPSGRATISFMRDRSVRFGTFRFDGEASIGQRSWQLDGIDEWPPQGAGAMLLEPQFGGAPPAQGVTYAHIEPLRTPDAGSSGDYRVTAVARDVPTCGSCTTLAFGVNAASAGALPNVGDAIHLAVRTDPPLSAVSAAVGGGPLLVKSGAAFRDPDPPSPAEALQHDPQAGALQTRDGGLAFVCIDGRAKAISIGLTRPEFGALLEGLGAVDGLAFDSGGSATLVARAPGDAAASVQSLPSDGHERNVADGVFIYSDAPPGSPARLALRPRQLRLVAGAQVPVSAIVLDADGRPVATHGAAGLFSVEPASLARVGSGSKLIAERAGSGVLRVRRGALVAEEPLTVVAAPAHLRIEPGEPNPARGGRVAFRAVGTGSAGEPILIDGAVHWAATAGTISADGEYTAGSGDAVVSANASGRRAEADVRVGASEAPFAAFAAAAHWQFATIPHGGSGSIAQLGSADGQPLLELSYDFSSGVRAAYANAVLPLPGRPLRISLEVRGDGAGAGLRAAFDNADGDRIAVTLARHVDWQGWRRCDALLPPNAVPPLRWRSIYLVAALAGAPLRTAGSVAFRDARFTFAGSVPEQ